MRPPVPVLNIDRVACDGRGMCAELLPELIDLDEWGYPVVRMAEVPPVLEEYARRAVAACPVLAFRLFEQPELASRASPRSVPPPPPMRR